MGTVGSDHSLQLNGDTLLGSCASPPKTLGCGSSCGPSCQYGSSGKCEDGALSNCFTCDRGTILGTIDEQFIHPPVYRSHQEKYVEVSDIQHVKPLIEPGDLVRVWTHNSPAAPCINDVYKIGLKPVGRGTYGEVYEGCHKQTGVQRAIKRIEKKGLERYVENVQSFIRREVDCLRRLDHPNIVRIYETYENEETTDLVLEMCEGGDLLDRLRLSQPRFPEVEAANVFGQMLGAIQHLHLRGVVHRDLKPENFLFKHREVEREPLPPAISPIKLIDFGLSRRLTKNGYTRLTPKIGTAEYMAPETFAGNVNPSHAHSADMWSMGVILHVIFLGHFPSPKLLQLTPEVYFGNPCFSNVSREGIDLITNLLRKDPRQRPSVNRALKHPWLRQGMRIENPVSMLIPAAVRAWRNSGRLRHLALLAIAREIDDRSVSRLRCMFQALEVECNGAITRTSLESVSRGHGNLALTAIALYSAFYLLDTDGSDAIDWTEFLAAVLSVNGKFSEATQSSTLSSSGWQEQGSDEQEFLAYLPFPTDMACSIVFDLFSQGSGAVTGTTLGELLAKDKGFPEHSLGAMSGEMLQAMGKDMLQTLGNTQFRSPEFDHMVNEVCPSGVLRSVDFDLLIKGDLLVCAPGPSGDYYERPAASATSPNLPT